MCSLVVKSVFLVALVAYCVQLYFHNSVVDPHIEGLINERFKLVYEVFRSNFVDGWERQGASLVVYQKGKKVVDIWGGYADKESGRLWQENTLNIAFSCTKLWLKYMRMFLEYDFLAVASICIARLVDQGFLNYDDLVEKHWPGFGKNGKENITIRWLLGHRAGLAWTDHKIHLDIANDSEAISRVFEEQRPNWPPGTEIGYHALTFGWLVDQLIRRVDPKGRSIGMYFKQDIADKYNLDFHIGLPKCEAYRVARIARPSFWNFLQEYAYSPSDFQVGRWIHHMLTNGSLFKVGQNVPWIAFIKGMTLNNPDIFSLEQAAVLGISTSRAMAELFELLRRGELMKASTFKQLTTGYVKEPDVITGANVPRGQGMMIKEFQHNGETHELIGHSGYGGQNVRIDIKNEITLAYMSNGLKVGFGDTSRTYVRLLHAIYDAVKQNH